LDSYVGVNGSQLSGGQQQRVAIARIFLKDPEIIIIDEATSGIDTITEEQIFRKLKEIYRKAIIIVVSHRLSSIKDFATIFHLHEGKIEDAGDHNLLLSKRGTYWELFRNQL
jgi:ABC-type multidrug transport system fused ATPase/permease subunit